MGDAGTQSEFRKLASMIPLGIWTLPDSMRSQYYLYSSGVIPGNWSKSQKWWHRNVYKEEIPHVSATMELLNDSMLQKSLASSIYVLALRSLFKATHYIITLLVQICLPTQPLSLNGVHFQTMDMAKYLATYVYIVSKGHSCGIKCFLQNAAINHTVTT